MASPFPPCVVELLVYRIDPAVVGSHRVLVIHRQAFVLSGVKNVQRP